MLEENVNPVSGTTTMMDCPAAAVRVIASFEPVRSLAGSMKTVAPVPEAVRFSEALLGASVVPDRDA